MTTSHAAVGQQQPQGRRAAVAIIIDNSGSMADSDPNGLRLTAAELLVNLLENGDQAALIGFSAQSQVAVSMRTLNGDADRDAFKNALAIMRPSGATDMVAAFQDAEQQLTGPAATAEEKFILFLTDGEPEPVGWASLTQQQQSRYLQQLNDLVTRSSSLGIPIFAVSLEQAVNTQLLGGMADKTGGLYLPAPTAADIGPDFRQIFARLKHTNLVPYLPKVCVSPAGPATVVQPLPVDRFVLSLILNITADPGVSVSIRDPQGVEQQGTSRSGGGAMVRRYELPMPGSWSIMVTGSGCVGVTGFPTVEPMQVVIRQPQPGVFPPGQPLMITADVTRPAQDKQPAPVPDSDVSATVIGPNGSPEQVPLQWTGSNYQGSYANTNRVGRFTAQVRAANGQDSVMSQQIGFELADKPQLSVEAPQPRLDASPGDTVPVRVRASSAQIGGPAIAATVMQGGGTSITVPLTKQGDEWAGSFRPAVSGDYTISFRLTGKYGDQQNTLFETDQQVTTTIALRDLPQPTLEAPSNQISLVVGESFNVRARVPSTDVQEPAMTLRITPPSGGGDPTDVRLSLNGDVWAGTYQPQRSGNYQLEAQLSGKSGSTGVPFNSKRSASTAVMLQMPAVAAVVPGKVSSLGDGGKLPLAASLQLDGKPLSDAQNVQWTATYTKKGSKEKPAALPIGQQGPSLVTSFAPKHEGVYSVAVSAKGTRNGVAFTAQEQQSSDVQVTFSTWRKLRPLWWVPMLMLALLLAAFALTRPRIPQGLALYLDGTESGKASDVSPRSWLTGAVYAGRTEDAIALDQQDRVFQLRPLWTQFWFLRGGPASRLRIRPENGAKLTKDEGDQEMAAEAWDTLYPGETVVLHTKPRNRAVRLDNSESDAPADES